MKKLITLLTLVALTTPVLPDGLEEHRENTEALYQAEEGKDGGFFSNTATSMVGWGVGLAVGIALLTAAMKQSKSSSSSSSSSSSN